MDNKEVYLKCIRCKKVVEWILENGTKHIKGTCPDCGYTKWMPRAKPLKDHYLYFGKHKGKSIVDIPTDYLKWGIENDVIGGGTAFAVIELLKQKGINVENHRNV